MMKKSPVAQSAYFEKFTSQKVTEAAPRLTAEAPDSLAAWMSRYLSLATLGVRSEGVARKIALHPELNLRSMP